MSTSRKALGVGRTEPLSVHRLRSTARRQERHLQRVLDGYGEDRRPPIYTDDGVLVPSWARGVRVEKAGLFQFVLVATAERGH